MKRTLALILTIAIMCGLSTSALALERSVNNQNEAGLYYLYTNNVSSTISISSKTATCRSTVVGQSGVTTKIVITQRLQKKVDGSWTNVKSWTNTYNQTSAVFINTKASLASGTYRTRTIAKVYKGTAYETIYANSVTTTC